MIKLVALEWGLIVNYDMRVVTLEEPNSGLIT